MHESSFGRLIGVLVAPGKTFQSIERRPTWVVPLLLLCLVSALSAYLVTERIDFRAAMEKQMEDRGQEMSPEQVDQMVEMQERFGSIFAPIGAVIFIALFFLLMAGLYLGAFRFFAGSEITFKQSFSTVLYAATPIVLATLLTIPVILGRTTIDPEQAQAGLLSSNLAAFAPEDVSPVVRALLASIDFFGLWILILSVLGYRIVARVSTGTAVVTVLVLWLLTLAVRVGWVAAFS
jgi:hypothetical protein